MDHQDLAGVQVGDRLPEIVFGPVTRAMLALYAGASGDHNPIHIDSDMATAAGMPDVFAHGMLSFGVLAQVPSHWAGAKRLKSIAARFLSLTHVHDTIRCTGEVTEIFASADGRRARVLITATAHDGRTTLAGEAIVSLA